MDLRRFAPDGSYDAEGYWQTGDLEWEVQEDGQIFVTTYSYTDFAGVSDVEGWTFDVLRDGRVLVEVRPNGTPIPGGRYVRLG